jgi:diadenylate cyclase
MMNWILEKMWIVFAVTLPIVFQPELRRILEQLGQGRFFVSSSSAENMDIYDAAIKEIGEAVRVLSRNRTGALIVIKRETGIEEYMDSGTDLDSLVSSGILINIFVPNTPLHDGAVIIKEGRIQKAACFLPLSINPNIDGLLGTRHRAGLGISEVSDALAVIVSEETGSISLARDGRLVRYLDAQSLKTLLEAELIVRQRPRDNFWRRWITDGRNESQKKKDMA